MDDKLNMKQRILDESYALISEGGLSALTFDAVARRLGVTKQAVIYWYPRKQDLVRALAIPMISAESDAVVAALEGVSGARNVVSAVVRTLVAFHTADLDRFRQMYLSVQLDRRPDLFFDKETLETCIHPQTGRMYAAIEAALLVDPGLRSGLSPRRAAVVIDAATLGLITMIGLGDSVNDPLAHSTGDLVDTLVSMLTDGVSG